MAKKLRILTLVLGALAALGLAGAAWSVPGTLRLAAGERAEGTVVAFKRIGNSSHLVVRYAVPDGRSVEFTSQVSRPGDVRVGEIVPVKYDRRDPSLAEVDSFPTIWGRVMIPGVVGLVFGAMAVVTLFLRRFLPG